MQQDVNQKFDLSKAAPLSVRREEILRNVILSRRRRICFCLEEILRHSVPQDDAELNENVRSEP